VVASAALRARGEGVTDEALSAYTRCARARNGSRVAPPRHVSACVSDDQDSLQVGAQCDAERLAEGVGVRTLVDRQIAHAALLQLERELQSHRASARDQNVYDRLPIRTGNDIPLPLRRQNGLHR